MTLIQWAKDAIQNRYKKLNKIKKNKIINKNTISNIFIKIYIMWINL